MNITYKTVNDAERCNGSLISKTDPKTVPTEHDGIGWYYTANSGASV